LGGSRSAPSLDGGQAKTHEALLATIEAGERHGSLEGLTAEERQALLTRGLA
jgi:hypothetical protein